MRASWHVLNSSKTAPSPSGKSALRPSHTDTCAWHRAHVSASSSTICIIQMAYRESKKDLPLSLLQRCICCRLNGPECYKAKSNRCGRGLGWSCQCACASEGWRTSDTVGSCEFSWWLEQCCADRERTSCRAGNQRVHCPPT